MPDFKIKWFSALPQSKIEYGDQTIDFSSDATFDKIVTDFSTELARYSPSMIRNHTDNGEVLGLVRHMRVLTLQQAKDLGITKQTSKRMIYLGVLPKRAGGLDSIEYVSVGITPHVKDEEGKTSEYWLSELSATGTPHIRYQQTPGSELEKIAFSAAEAHTFTAASSLDRISFVTTTSESEPQPIEQDTKMEEQIKSLTDQLVAVKAAKGESDTALETANARITELEAELKTISDAKLEAEATTAVADLEVPTELAVKLKALFVSSRESFDIAVEGIKFSMAASSAKDGKAGETGDGNPKVKLELSARKAKEGKGEETEVLTPEQIAKEAYALQAAASAEGKTLTFGAAVSQIKNKLKA